MGIRCWVMVVLIGALLTFAGEGGQPSKAAQRLSDQKRLVLSAQQTKQLIQAVLEADRGGSCADGKCRHPKVPLIHSWHPEVPPVLVVQLTGVRAPLPLEMEWRGTFTSAGSKRTLNIRVLIVPQLTFTKKAPYLRYAQASRESFRDGSDGPRYYLRQSERSDPALHIEVAGRTMRGLAAWLAIGEQGDTKAAFRGCMPLNPKALPATFTLYDGTSFITPDQRHQLALTRDRQGNWQAQYRGAEMYL
ncbi:MAG: hypothetical protein NZL85_04455 [Fimbriimonadales bacterium]|nr:hypothetical protein [Fimbriimonadales bacterium]